MKCKKFILVMSFIFLAAATVRAPGDRNEFKINQPFPPTQDICGDGICSDGERFSKSCERDCGKSFAPSPPGQPLPLAGDICGDEKCSKKERFSKSCEQDCIEDKSTSRPGKSESNPPVFRKRTANLFGWWMQGNPVSGPPLTHQETKMVLDFNPGIGWTIIDYSLDRDFRKPYAFKSQASREYYDYVNYLRQKNIDIVQLLEIKSLTKSTKIVIKEASKLPPDLVKFYNDLKDYVTTYKGSIKYWMIRHEMATGWRVTSPGEKNNETLNLIVQDYAIMYRIYYKAIKEADPDAQIILGAFWYPDWFDDFDNPFRNPKKDTAIDFFNDLKYLEEVEKGKIQDMRYKSHPGLDQKEYELLISKDDFDNYFDIVANSISPGRVEYEKYSERFAQLLADNGYPGIPIWMHDNYPVNHIVGDKPEYCYGMCLSHPDGALTEIEAAQQIINRVLIALPYVNRVNVNYIGVLTSVDPSFCDGKNYECGYKRLGFYAYRKLIEKIDSFTSIEKIVSSKNGQVYIRVYKYSFKDKSPIWVAFQTLEENSWGSFFISSSPTTLTLDVGNIKKVRITKTIPKYDSGKDIDDYNTAFEMKTKTVRNGRIEITFDRTPIYIEERI